MEMKDYKYLAMLITCLFLLSCASPHIVEERQIGDESLSCSQIEAQIAEATRFEKEARGEKGVTGTNAAALIFFWPALLFTYDNVGDAVDAANDRKDHLHAIYSQKNCDTESSTVKNEEDKQLSNKIMELSDLYKQGLLTEEEYNAAKREALGL
jgi:putative oligomerization/nucleic acid binding protein